MYMHSTTSSHRCLYSREQSGILGVLSLYFPVGYKNAAESAPRVLHTNSLIALFFRVENLHKHLCTQCGLVGGTEKKFDIIKAPQHLIWICQDLVV